MESQTPRHATIVAVTTEDDTREAVRKRGAGKKQEILPRGEFRARVAEEIRTRSLD